MAVKQLQKANCAYCGKEFDKNRKAKIYCSNDCRNAFNWQVKKSKMVKKVNKPVKCGVCGKEFMRNSNNGKYCDSCRAQIKADVKSNYVRKTVESLCWSCAKAWAKPDPEGCGKFRSGEKVWQEAIEKQVTYGGGVETTMQIVACEQYVKSERE